MTLYLGLDKAHFIRGNIIAEKGQERSVDQKLLKDLVRVVVVSGWLKSEEKILDKL